MSKNSILINHDSIKIKIAILTFSVNALTIKILKKIYLNSFYYFETTFGQSIVLHCAIF